MHRPPIQEFVIIISYYYPYYYHYYSRLQSTPGVQAEGGSVFPYRKMIVGPR